MEKLYFFVLDGEFVELKWNPGINKPNNTKNLEKSLIGDAL